MSLKKILFETKKILEKEKSKKARTQLAESRLLSLGATTSSFNIFSWDIGQSVFRFNIYIGHGAYLRWRERYEP